LYRIPLRAYLPHQFSSDQDDLRSADSAGFSRKLKIAADVRPALLAPPPIQIPYTLQLPDGPYRLWLSYGILEERREQWAEVPMTFQARLQGDAGSTQILQQTLHPPSRLEDHGWQEFRYNGRGKGEQVELILEVNATSDCEEIGAFGQPRLAALGEEARPPNILLISLDTLRADHLGCYDYVRDDGNAVSPNLDAFAADHLLFRECRSSAPYTLPSHATLLTGLYPKVHGVSQFQTSLHPDLHELLPHRFAEEGYVTAGFTAGGFVSYEHGFHHGFDQYSILDPFLTVEDPFRKSFPRAGDSAFNDAMFSRYDTGGIQAWLQRHQDVPFFLFVHSYVAHNYFPPKQLQQRFVRADPLDFLNSDRGLKKLDVEAALEDRPVDPQLLNVLIDLYDATIFSADQQVGQLLDELKRLELWDRTLVLITSDHGEEFGEHHGLLHGRSVYEEMLRVPLLLHVPGIPGQAIASPVDHTDVAPTLLDFAGLAPLQRTSGRSLLDRLQSGQFLQQGWGEVDAENLTERYAYYQWPFKLIYNPDTAREEREYQQRRPVPWELFDLQQDPQEQQNLLRYEERPRSRTLLPDAEQPANFPELQTALQNWLEGLQEERELVIGDGSQLSGKMSEEQRQLLIALGYLED
jgi:arylsulfatase A-like enzyme